jgi:hypothetical protein
MKPTESESPEPAEPKTPEESNSSESSKPNSEEQTSLIPYGLGLRVRRNLRKKYKDAGLEDKELPELLQDKELLRSRKGKLGAISIREFSGVQQNKASKLTRKLENQLTDGREDIMEKYEALVEKPPTVRKLLEVMREKPNISFTRAIAEAKVDPALALDFYAKGAMALQKTETLLELYKGMPAIFRDLMRHAIDKDVTCDVCMGVGRVQPRAGSNTLSLPCPRCGGNKTLQTSSKHKEFAMTKVLEMSQMMPPKTPLVAVNQNQLNVTAVTEGGLLEKMSKMADEVLYNRSFTSPVVDAEIVEGNDGGKSENS